MQEDCIIRVELHLYGVINFQILMEIFLGGANQFILLTQIRVLKRVYFQKIPFFNQILIRF